MAKKKPELPPTLMVQGLEHMRHQLEGRVSIRVGTNLKLPMPPTMLKQHSPLANSNTWTDIKQ